MSVIGLAQEAPDSPEGHFEFGKQVVIRRFKVRTNSVYDGPGTVSFAPGIPYMFTPYYFGGTDLLTGVTGFEAHPLLLVRRIEPRRLSPRSLYWEVVVTYETPDVKSYGGGPGEGGRGGGVGGGDGSGKEGTGVDTPGEYTNPLLEVPELETHMETQQQPIYGCFGKGVKCAVSGTTVKWPTNNYNISWVQAGDSCAVSAAGVKTLYTTVAAVDNTSNSVTLTAPWSGPSPATFIDLQFRPVSASNNEPFVPPPTMDSSKLILTITRNEPITAPHPAIGVLYQDAVNNDVFWGVNPGLVKVANVSVRRETRQIAGNPPKTFIYLRVSYTFHFKGSGWDVQLLDKGTWYWSQPNKSKDPDQTIPAKKMKGSTDDGQPIDVPLDGTGHKLPDNTKPVFLTVRPYNWVNFSALNLPQSFSQVQ